MDAPVGECSSGIIPKGAKTAYAAIAVVGMVRSRSKPKVPVQPGGRIGGGRIAHSVRPTVAVNPFLGKQHLPHFSPTSQLPPPYTHFPLHLPTANPPTTPF